MNSFVTFGIIIAFCIPIVMGAGFAIANSMSKKNGDRSELGRKHPQLSEFCVADRRMPAWFPSKVGLPNSTAHLVWITVTMGATALVLILPMTLLFPSAYKMKSAEGLLLVIVALPFVIALRALFLFLLAKVRHAK